MLVRGKSEEAVLRVCKGGGHCEPNTYQGSCLKWWDSGSWVCNYAYEGISAS